MNWQRGIQRLLIVISSIGVLVGCYIVIQATYVIHRESAMQSKWIDRYLNEDQKKEIGPWTNFQLKEKMTPEEYQSFNMDKSQRTEFDAMETRKFGFLIIGLSASLWIVFFILRWVVIGFK